jgi:hypothetical protein
VNNIDKINVLMKEYEALRAEIRSRSDNQFTLLGFAGLVLTWLFSRSLAIRHWLELLAVIVPILLFMNFLIIQAIKRCAYRLMAIEKQVNSFAGDHLLEWETRWGMQTTGLFRSKPRNWRPA